MSDSDERVGPYRILSKIGEDQNGTTWIGRRDGGDRVVVRLLRTWRPERFAALKVLRHPRLASVLDVGEHNAQPYIVSELAEGETLEAAVARGGAFRDEGVELIATGLLEALDALHRAGVAHGNLTPRDVVLSGDGIRLTGFGSDLDAEPPADLPAWGRVVTFASVSLPERLRQAVAMAETASAGEILRRLRDGGTHLPEAAAAKRNLWEPPHLPGEGPEQPVAHHPAKVIPGQVDPDRPAGRKLPAGLYAGAVAMVVTAGLGLAAAVAVVNEAAPTADSASVPFGTPEAGEAGEAEPLLPEATAPWDQTHDPVAVPSNTPPTDSLKPPDARPSVDPPPTSSANPSQSPDSSESPRQSPSPSPSSSESPSPSPSSCGEPVYVAAAPEVAGGVERAAGSMAEGRCPDVKVARTASGGTALSSAPRADIWIPSSSLWPRLGKAGFPARGTSIVRSPVVLAFPKRIFDRIKGPNTWPVWVMVNDKLEKKQIPEMSMPDAASTTEGALAWTALHAAMMKQSKGHSGGAAMRSVFLRNNLSNRHANVDALLGRLRTGGTGVGVFPATEQRILRHNRSGPAVAVVAMGTYDGIAEADYPMVVSNAAQGDPRRAKIADRLRDRLLSPEGQNAFKGDGFRPASSNSGLDKQRYPDYPAPVGVPNAGEWKSLMSLWRH